MQDRSATIHLPNFVGKGKIISNNLTSSECFCIILNNSHGDKTNDFHGYEPVVQVPLNAQGTRFGC